MDTTENNTLIAIFLGWKLNGSIFTFDESLFTFSSSNLFKDDLEFHSSWDWLMPVVEKIEMMSIDITNSRPYKSNKDRFKEITQLNPEFMLGYDNREEFKGWYYYVCLGTCPTIHIKESDERLSSKINAQYIAIIEFIKWYNENKK